MGAGEPGEPSRYTTWCSVPGEMEGAVSIWEEEAEGVKVVAEPQRNKPSVYS